MSKRVLVVDDEPNIVMSIEFLMKRAGFEVEVARNGARGDGRRSRDLRRISCCST